MSEYLTWVVGRGLLGRHIETALERTGEDTWRPAEPIPWTSPFARVAIGDKVERFFTRVMRSGSQWRILWCAGRGVIATPADELAADTAIFGAFLAACASACSSLPDRIRPGLVMLASSAGALYWKSSAPPPYDEWSPVGPDSAYGWEKLAQERLLADVRETLGIDALIARFSNLYGPGQDVSKPQGLVSHVGWATLRREPVSIYVPLDTIRDYLLASDAGRMVVTALRERAVERHSGQPVAVTTKIFASEIGTSVASVLGTWRQTMRRPVRVAFGRRQTEAHQPRVLSFRSRVWPQVRGLPTTLPIGIELVHRDQLSIFRRFGVRGRLSDFSRLG